MTNAAGVTLIASEGPGATVVVAQSSGRVGSTVNASGAGFLANQPLTLDFIGASDSGPLPGSCVSNSTGSFSCLVQVPALPVGPYNLSVTDGVNTGLASYTILPPVLSISPVVGYVASNSTANGSGFDPGVSVTLVFNGTAITSCESGTSLRVNDAGNFSCRFLVPASPAGVSNLVSASDGINTATARYTINHPTLSLNPISGNVGSAVSATGEGFDPGVALLITFGTTAISHCSSGSTTATAFGELSCSFSVPVLAPGRYLVNVSDYVNSAPSAPFQIGPPFLSLSVTHGPVGSSTAATGSGFAPSEPVTLEFGSTFVSACSSGSLTADGSGALSCTFTVPASPSGPETVGASDSVSTADATFDVVPSLALSRTNGSFNETVTATGTGLDADAIVAVGWNSTSALCTATTGSNGSFSCSFLVPSAPGGSYTVTATEGQNAPSAPFQVDPTVVLSSTSRDVGQPEIANGYGFQAISSISILWDPSTAECSGSSTHSTGAVTCAFLVPATPGGEHIVSFVQGALEVNRSLTVASSFSIDPTTGVVGLNVQLIGTAFQASTQYEACLESSLVSCPSGPASFSTDANGSIPPDTNFPIPAEPTGNYDLVISSSGSIAGEAAFVVTIASVGLEPNNGSVGTPVNLVGSGFAPDTTYAYCFQVSVGPCPSETLTDFTSTASGTIPSGILPLPVPANPAGIYYVDASQGANLMGSGEFRLVSNAIANVTSATVGSTVGVDGTGFPALTSYEAAWNSSVVVCLGTTNSTGGFTCSFALPPAVKGAHQVLATSGPDLANFTLTVLSALNLTPKTVSVGTTVQAIGTGFDYGSAYSLLWNYSVPLCSGWTNALGSLSCSFSVPAAPAGARPVSVKEGSNNVTVGLVVVPSLVPAPSDGVVGSFARIAGAGFDANSQYNLRWNTSTLLCSGATNATGGFACAFSVPVAPEGPNTIKATEGSNSGTAAFTVLANIGISPAAGPVGGQELLGGTGLAAGAAYSVWWNGSTKLCSGSANSNGELHCAFTVPTSPAGTYNLTVLEGGSTFSAPFAIVPSFLASLGAGTVNSLVRISGGGFDADASFGLSWNSTVQLCAGTTTSNGNLTCAFEIPNSPGGPHTIVLSQGSHSLVASLTVLPSFSISQLNATAGTSLTVAGDGFTPSEPYAVSMTPTGGTLCTGVANGNGAFECTFVIPSVPTGVYSISLTQGSTGLSRTLFVTSSPSPSPSTPFPWWLVALVVIAALAGALAIYRQVRRESGSRRPPAEPSPGLPVRPRAPRGGGRSPPVASPVGPTPRGPPSFEPSEPGAGRRDLDERIVPKSRKGSRVPDPARTPKTPASQSRVSTHDTDVLVARLGPVFQDVLPERLPPGAYSGSALRMLYSGEDMRARIGRLAPAYREILEKLPKTRPKDPFPESPANRP